MRCIKNFIKTLIEILNSFLSRINLLIIPIHYYTPIKKIKNIEKSKLLKKVDFKKIKFNKKKNIIFLYSIKKEIFLFKNRNTYDDLKKNFDNIGPGYGKIESIILQSIIKKKKIKRILEIGSGISTLCMLDSLKISNIKNYEMLCIEPNPSDLLINLMKQKKIKLIQKKVEDISVTNLLNFKPELLFVDTTHTVKPLSDVEFIYTRILPNIKDCLIHIHDIYFPYLYQNNLLKSSFMQWSETMILYCYLLNNNNSEIILSMPHIFHENKKIIKKLFQSFKLAKFKFGLQKNLKNSETFFPSSIYLQQ